MNYIKERKMKRFALSLFMLVSVSAVAVASDVVYNEELVAGSVAKDVNYTLDISNKGIDKLSFQALYSSANYASKTFTDGVKSYGNIVVSTTTGIADAVITINGISLIEGVHWSKNIGYSTATARSISLAIQAHPSLKPIVLSTAPTNSNIVGSTAIIAGINYSLTSSVPAALVVTGFSGGVASNIYGNRINVANTYPTGLTVMFSTATGGTAPTGLVSDTTYFVIATDGNSLQLASSKANAVAGTYLTIAQPTNPVGATFTLTPKNSITGGYSFRWKASNDGSNWNDLSVTSVTVITTTGHTSSVWDFGDINYAYIRCAVLSAVDGALNLTLRGFGRKVAP